MRLHSLNLGSDAMRLQVQDEAAGAVIAFMEPKPGEKILDGCAAPGGKATFIAQRMRGEVTKCMASSCLARTVA